MINLIGKKGLIVGIANDKSIAYGVAARCKEMGAEIAATYLNEKAEKFVRPLAEQLGCPIILPLDVQNPDQMEALFSAIRTRWGKLDFLLHSIAFAPKNDLQGRVVDCSVEGFIQAMDISCHSLIRLAKAAEPLMIDGGSIITMSYYGSEKVVKHYNMMGPVKAALESAARYMAVELGKNNIRVNVISPGAILTRAASGIDQFNDLLAESQRKAAIPSLVTVDDVGCLAAFLFSDQAKHITGGTHYVDAGYEIVD